MWSCNLPSNLQVIQQLSHAFRETATFVLMHILVEVVYFKYQLMHILMNLFQIVRKLQESLCF